MGTALSKSAHALLRAYKPPARACGLLVLSDAVKSLFKLVTQRSRECSAEWIGIIEPCYSEAHQIPYKCSRYQGHLRSFETERN